MTLFPAFIEGFSCLRQFFIFEYRNRDTAALGRRDGVFCIECFYAKVHLNLHFVYVTRTA